MGGGSASFAADFVPSECVFTVWWHSGDSPAGVATLAEAIQTVRRQPGRSATITGHRRDCGAIACRIDLAKVD